MKMSEIKVGEEYAVGLSDWDKRHPKRARVLEVNAKRDYTTGVSRSSMGWRKSADDGVKIVYLDSKGEVSQIRDTYRTGEIIDHIEILVARAIIKPWAEWAKEDREWKKVQKRREDEKAKRNIKFDARLEAIRDKFPEGSIHRNGLQWKNQYRNEVVIDLEALEALVRGAS